MKNIKRIIALGLASAMVMSLVACGSSSDSTEEAAEATTEEAASAAEEAEEETEEAVSEEAEEVSAEAEETEEAAASDIDYAAAADMTIAYVGKVEGQAWWDHVAACVDEWAEETGINAFYQASSSTDAAEQVAIMTDLVNQGEIDVLLFSANDPDACEEICKQAMEAGIYVISTESSTMTNVTYDVEPGDDTKCGEVLMEALAEQMGYEGQYMTMVGSLTMESQNNWADAAVAYQEANYPDMELVGDRLCDDSDADQAYNLCKEAVAAYPELKGILGTGSFDAPGCARAIDEMGLTGQMFAISIAMPSEVGDYIQSGTLGSVGLWDAGVSAKAMLNLAVMLYNGVEIGDTVNLGETEYADCSVNGTLIIGDGYVTIDQSNIDYWLETGI